MRACKARTIMGNEAYLSYAKKTNDARNTADVLFQRPAQDIAHTIFDTVKLYITDVVEFHP